MERIKTMVLLSGLAVALVSLPALAKQGTEKVKGQVIAVQGLQGDSVGQLVTVRTRNSEQRQLRLRDSSGCSGCVQVGDQVRARVSNGMGEAQGQIQGLRVRRGDEMYRYGNQDGQLVRTQQRLRDGGGQQTGRQTRSRAQTPGKGNCRGGGGGKGPN